MPCSLAPSVAPSPTRKSRASPSAPSTRASTCTYKLSSNSQTFTQSGGSGAVVLTTDNSCPWSTQSNASWLTVNGNQSGAGTATIQFSVAPNTTSNTSLSSSINIAGIGFTVDEETFTGPVGLNFVPVTPCRIADTRNPDSPFGGPYLSGQSTRALAIPSSNCNIPSNAQAYSLNVTVVPHKTLGYLTVWPTGEPQPVVSTLNSFDGRVKANTALIQAGTNGQVSFFATDDTDLVLDINGYFVPYLNNTGLSFNPLTPCRVADTRNASGPLGGPALVAGQARDFPILQSNCNLPAFAQAYSMNFTAVPPAGTPLGYLSVWPSGQTQPLVSTLNAPTAAVTANSAIVPAGPTGDATVYGSSATDLVVDVNGYFASLASGYHFYPVPPCRAFDSRSAGAGQPLQGTLFVPITGSCGVSTYAAAVVLNATVVPIGPLGFLTLWPYGLTQPVASNLNSSDGTVVSNMAIVPLLSGGINAYAPSNTHLILDVTGYFAQ